MKDIHIQQIEDLMIYEHNYLVQESKEEGFNFLIKLKVNIKIKQIHLIKLANVYMAFFKRES